MHRPRRPLKARRGFQGPSDLRPESIARTLAARADGHHGDVGCGKRILGLAGLANLGNSIHDTANEANEDGGYAAECGGCVEEDQTANGKRKLVQSANHGVSCRRGDTDTPSGGVRDENGGNTRNQHGGDDIVALIGREALCKVRRRPIFENNRGDDKDGNGEQVVVVHGWRSNKHCDVTQVAINLLS